MSFLRMGRIPPLAIFAAAHRPPSSSPTSAFQLFAWDPCLFPSPGAEFPKESAVKPGQSAERPAHPPATAAERAIAVNCSRSLVANLQASSNFAITL
jgi:hypothetical protein